MEKVLRFAGNDMFELERSSLRLKWIDLDFQLAALRRLISYLQFVLLFELNGSLTRVHLQGFDIVGFARGGNKSLASKSRS